LFSHLVRPRFAGNIEHHGGRAIAGDGVGNLRAVMAAHAANAGGASEVVLWGSGTPLREFLHVDDLAAACLFVLENYDSADTINVGVGQELTIRELAELVADVVGYEGELVQDISKPDGTPRKLLDVSRINDLGWKATVPLRDGIAATYKWFLEHQTEIRG
jgi:GDP-L-fucose synthase